MVLKFILFKKNQAIILKYFSVAVNDGVQSKTEILRFIAGLDTIEL